MSAEAFANSELLHDASSALRAVIDELAVSLEVSEGHDLFQQGDPGDALYFILSGRLEVSVLSADGRELTLNAMGTGEVLGEIALLDHGPRTATVSALESSRLMRVSRADLIEAVRENPELGIEMMALAGARLRWISSQLEERAFDPLRLRLARRLLYLARNAKDHELRLSQDALASHVGATRVAVANILGEWRKNGTLKISRGRIAVLNTDQLASIAFGTEN